MQCWICGAPASATCRFCGRAVCRDDARIHPFVLEVYEAGGTHFGLAVEDAIHCGVCKPKPEPVQMDFLDEPAAPRETTRRKGPRSDEQHGPDVSKNTVQTPPARRRLRSDRDPAQEV